MASESINVRVTGELRKFVNFQTGVKGVYETPSEYIRDLIRRDKEHDENEGWSWLVNHLQEGIEADESEFTPVSAQQVIERCHKKYINT